MSFVDEPDPPGAARVGLGLFAAGLIPLAALLTGSGEGFLFALIGLPQLVVLFMPLALWLLPKSRSPILTAVGLGAVTGPLSPALVSLQLGFDWDIVLAFIVTGAIGGFCFWLVVVAGNPYFGDEARQGRSG